MDSLIERINPELGRERGMRSQEILLKGRKAQPDQK